MDRFNTTKEELVKLGSEFYSEALPLLEKLYKTTYWIFLERKATKKIIKQVYFEAIEYCDKTKSYADWQSWIYRIWMREIFDYYAPKENNTQTIFDFIDFVEVNPNDVKTLFNNESLKFSPREAELIKSLNKIPAVLRIPLIMKEINSFNYEKIAELIDVPDGVIATRIYRARKLLFLFLKGNFDYEKEKQKGLPNNFRPIIFEKRRSTLFVDDELNEEQKDNFIKTINEENEYKAEVLIQENIKKLFGVLTFDESKLRRVKAKIERKAKKRFGNN